MPSPAKPWESQTSTMEAIPAAASTTLGATNPTTNTSNNIQPELPTRSTTTTATMMNNRMNANQMGYQNGGMYGANQFGGGYGGMGYNTGYGYGNYGSQYGSRFGGAYNNYSPMSNRFGYNRMGMMEPDQQLSYVQQMEQATQPTFQVLESIVQTFGSFAQMLESTFFATQSSFMAMVGVADQLSQAKQYFQNLFSLARLLNLFKRIGYRMMGEVPPIDPKEISAQAFQEYNEQSKRPSKKPLFVFFAMVIGIPWLLSKLLKRIQEKLPKNLASLAPSDISNLEFCKALFDYNSNMPGDLGFRKGDLVAIISKNDVVSNEPSEWWSGRTHDGRMGTFPSNYVEIIPKNTNSSEPTTVIEKLP